MLASTFNSTIFAVQDIFLNFRTAYVDEMGDLVTGYKAVASNYLQTWFILDAISIFPLDVLVADSQLGILRLFKSVRYCCSPSLQASCRRCGPAELHDPRLGTAELLQLLGGGAVSGDGLCS